MGFTGIPRAVAEWVGQLGLSQGQLLLALTLLYIVLGCLLDGISMVLLTMAVLLPVVTAAKFDLLWFGIYIVIVVEMAQVTPPVGFNLFVLQSMTRRDIGYVSRVAFPFFLIMLFFVIVIYLFPDVVTWLPRQMGKG
jgi:TRAP-type C4-dicarboxylate transport system permease large subunit